MTLGAQNVFSSQGFKIQVFTTPDITREVVKTLGVTTLGVISQVSQHKISENRMLTQGVTAMDITSQGDENNVSQNTLP